eukprot:CAMPEP_0184498736 /NCGR_PEP_ID=MMETSP0113_2-20130426/39687_1 /TAXON_ID=91329 /ORGANISM="Norrisiella sphaerica, Strain BC52" /LENGTH=424 /DNA_ID=CAMNT_0026886373 /DNA_START=175 /DNA_END=1446 /DNA_ORIENTATION=+
MAAFVLICSLWIPSAESFPQASIVQRTQKATFPEISRVLSPQRRRPFTGIPKQEVVHARLGPVAAAIGDSPPSPPLPEDTLPETVGYFYVNKCHVYLQGTIHGSMTSSEEVSKLLRHPKIKNRVRYVVMELDYDRYWYLQTRRKGTLRNRKKSVWKVLRSIITDPDQEKKGQAMLGLLLSSAMRAGESLEFEKGVDFLAAMDFAEEYNVPLVLADHSTNTTVGEMFREFSVRSLGAHVSQLPRNLPFLMATLQRAKHGTVSFQSALGRLPRAAQLFLTVFFALAVSSELPFEWNVTAKHNDALDYLASVERYMLIYLALCLPRVLKVLFTQRDLRILKAIEMVTAPMETSIEPVAASMDSPILNPGSLTEKESSEKNIDDSPVVVAVIGLAHVNSILNLFHDKRLREFAAATVQHDASRSVESI